jgi:hypothetical protein
MDLVAGAPGALFAIGAVTETLAVPKRRVYDVLAIWEGLGIARRARQVGHYHWQGPTGFAELWARIARAPPNKASTFLIQQETLCKGDSALRRTVFALLYLLAHPGKHQLGTDWNRKDFYMLYMEAASHALTNDAARRTYDVLNIMLTLSLVTATNDHGPRAHSRARYAWTPASLKCPTAPLEAASDQCQKEHNDEDDDPFGLDTLTSLDWAALPTSVNDQDETSNGSVNAGGMLLPPLFNLEMPLPVLVDFFQ